MTSRAPLTTPWWVCRPALTRFVADHVAAELAMLRHDPFMRAEGWNDSLSLEHDLALGPLEFRHLACTLTLALPMPQGGSKDYLSAPRTLGAWVDVAQAALQRHDGTLTFSSAGAAGRPKLAGHCLDRLEQEAQAVADLLSGRRRLLAAVSSHDVYGFVCTQLLPRHIGIDASQVVVIRARRPSSLAHWAQSGDLVIGDPRFWKAALAPCRDFPPDVVGVSATAPCPGDVADAAARYGIAALVQLYGSPETAGLGWRNMHHEDYRLYPYLERDPLRDNVVRRRLPGGGTEILQIPHHLAWRGERSFTVGARRDGTMDEPADPDID